MRIGLPNILPLFAFLFFGTISVTFTILFFDKVDTAETAATIFLSVFILLCYVMFGLLSYRFKVVAMTRDKLVIVFPFRLSMQSFAFDEIEIMKWDLWGVHKLGDYRKLVIQTKSTFKTNISDFEFMNYDALEKWLMDHVTLEFNLDKKTYVEVQQAMFNRWLNIGVILIVAFFMLLISTQFSDSNRRIVVIAIFVLIIWRLTVRLIQYQRRINESRQRRADWKRKTSH